MAITHALTTSYRVASYKAAINFEADTFKVALYTSAANLNKSTTAYTATGEVVGAGYTAGGKVLTGITVNDDGSTAFIDFVDPEWPASTFTARGALIYRVGTGDPSVAVIDFGVDKTVSSGLFKMNLPPATGATAIIRYTAP
jgi:hypothetical protein